MTDCDSVTGQSRNVKVAKVTFIIKSIRTNKDNLSHGVRHHHLGRGGSDRDMVVLVRRVVGVASQVVVLATDEAGGFEVKNGVLW